ncbi:MAG: 50S ribosomal protein L10 [Spirochaetaceae bacterium]|jgi:large subunit ribosomal protein L10|nr:50S ribosomal protein L10 [Spirochaetaceae bacterium]
MAIVAKNLQEAKVTAIGEVKAAFQTGGAPDFIFTEYRGLSVEQITALRKQLREKEALYKVVKNNFARIAFQELAAPDVSQYLTGPTAIAITPKDSNEVAKLLLDFAKEAPVLRVKGGVVAGSVYDAQQIEMFSKLPGKNQLIAMLMSVINAPARNVAAALNDVPARLVRTVKAVADKKAAGA